MESMLRRERLHWFGYVKKAREDMVLGALERLEVEVRRPVGRPQKTWRCTQEDLALLGVDEHGAETEWNGGAIKHQTAREVTN